MTPNPCIAFLLTKSKSLLFKSKLPVLFAVSRIRPPEFLFHIAPFRLSLLNNL